MPPCLGGHLAADDAIQQLVVTEMVVDVHAVDHLAGGTVTFGISLPSNH